MALRRHPLVTDEYYHVFNRGISYQPTYRNKKDYQQALFTLIYYRFAKPPVKLSRFKDLSFKEKHQILSNLELKNECLVNIVSFVFMPNHFHMLLKQNVDNGIRVYLSRFTNSYTRYFNTRYQRIGALFQGIFKSVYIETNEQLLHLSRYIHLNPVVLPVISVTDLDTYSWSSFPDYLKGKSNLVDLQTVLSQFRSVVEYKKFVYNQIEYAKKLEMIKHLAIDS